ncbi:MAG: UDP-N-acetylglucosamine--N-acetylmuramyl-(pentapeptide) pyrophosphoryl-undecaprenol N-acetylglucosamine transferase, partial [Firmicutes bacterium]|nr:UDP-N-acetylglucosamine--N-acetylmuramyl-(pentapeptide) pyrophosphoryl-undecaprenol N-acetylglucosamine transferase [Bacillota bacterium]
IRKFKPDIAIGTGGFVSFPVIIAAESQGVKCYIHEQNAAPGRGNKIMAKKARKIFTGFPGTEESLGFPEKTMYVGNPVREEFYQLDKSKSRKNLGIPENDLVIFSVGGSLGAEAINNIALEYARRINEKEGNTLICGTGRTLLKTYSELAENEGIELGGNIRMEGFISNIKDCIGAADLVICRGGAMSISELLVSGRPSIIIPYPGSVGDHQYYNGKTVQDAGGGIVYEQKDADPIVVCDKIEELVSTPGKLEEMGKACLEIAPSSVASTIYEEIMSDYEK